VSGCFVFRAFHPIISFKGDLSCRGGCETVHFRASLHATENFSKSKSKKTATENSYLSSVSAEGSDQGHQSSVNKRGLQQVTFSLKRIRTSDSIKQNKPFSNFSVNENQTKVGHSFSKMKARDKLHIFPSASVSEHLRNEMNRSWLTCSAASSVQAWPRFALTSHCRAVTGRRNVPAVDHSS